MEDAGIFLARPETPADGISLAVKDLFDTAGLTTTYGSAIFAEHVPDRTAEAVRRLEDAGYANVGKTNLHEFAYGITSKNPWFGPVPNPRAPGRIAGGSSGGSAAALAAGPGRRRARLGLRRLDPDPGGLLWRGRLQAEPRPGAARRLLPARAELRHGRADGAVRRRLHGDDARPSRPASSRTRSTRWRRSRSVLAWTELAEPLVRERVEAAAALFPRRRRLEAPLPA